MYSKGQQVARPIVAAGDDVWLLIDSSSVGGIERHVATLARTLLDQGTSCRVVLLDDHGPSPWHVQLADARVPFVVGGGALDLARRLRIERPRLLHTHGYKAGIVGRAIAHACRTPVVSTFHSGERPPFPLSAYYALDAWSSLFASRIAVSNDIQRRLPYSSNLIPNFVSPKPDSKPRALPRRIGFVGRLSHEKAPDVFCDVAERMGDVVEWHVYGDGVMRGGLQHRYGARVVFHGVIADMASVWPTLGALLMPSRFEGLPLAGLEALVSGVPVLASRVGGVPTLVLEGRTGWTFAAASVEGACAAVRSWLALDASAQHAMSQRCLDHVHAEFSTNSLVPRVVDVYRRAGLSLGGHHAAA